MCLLGLEKKIIRHDDNNAFMVKELGKEMIQGLKQNNKFYR